MRKFYIQKETGERIGLNNETGIFLTEPTGLGLNFGDNFADIGEGFFRMIAKKYNQNAITCKINFINDSYATYNHFVTWCMLAKSLYLVYQPENIEYYIRIEIESLEKGEINKYGYLECSASFIYLSPWYLPSPLNISFIGLDNTAFRWDNSRFDGTDILASSTADSYSAQIDSDGHLPGAFYIEYLGAAVNPIVLLTGIESDIVYGKCKITGNFAANTGFKLSTKYEDSYVRKILSDGTEQDILSSVDLSFEPFFKMPLNEPCILQLVDDGALHGDLTAKIYYYYRSV